MRRPGPGSKLSRPFPFLWAGILLLASPLLALGQVNDPLLLSPTYQAPPPVIGSLDDSPGEAQIHKDESKPGETASSIESTLKTTSLDPPLSSKRHDSVLRSEGKADFELKPTDLDPPLGFTGPSGVLPRTGGNDDFEPVEDRWRIGAPFWDRYGLGFPLGEDYPYKLGRAWDPFNQNVFKGDYPIIGQHTFFVFSATLSSLISPQEVPTSGTSFESTARQGEVDFFGRPAQLQTQTNVLLSFDLFEGDGSFKPADWRVKLTPVFNVNTLSVQELGIVSPNVMAGTERNRTFATLEEYFAEVKLADLSPEYDFVSTRVGAQPFTSDFRGFIFSDVNRAARIFGTLEGNRDQFNLIYFRQDEKDTNSGLNSFSDRNQNIIIANFYRQDFLFPGYTVEASVQYDDDEPSTLFDKNGFLVRPDADGIFQPHHVQAVYLGLAGDGHIDRFNISNAFYWALGHDSDNPLAGKPQTIDGKFAALEVSYDRDWVRFRASGLYQSGDGDINDKHATGFDSIMDNPNFAGSEFSYWGRQAISIFGVNLKQQNSLFVDLRSSKTQGQANFVNPGLWLMNAGIDFEITPKLRIVNNVNYMMFDKTNVLEQFLFQGNISRDIGLDISSGFEYRPLLSNNVIILGGIATLIPADGLKQIYGNFSPSGDKMNPLSAAFVQIVLNY